MISRREFVLFALAMGGVCSLPGKAFADAGDGEGGDVQWDSAQVGTAIVEPSGNYARSVVYSIDPWYAQKALTGSLASIGAGDAAGALERIEGKEFGGVTRGEAKEHLLIDVGTVGGSGSDALTEGIDEQGMRTLQFDGSFEELPNAYREIGNILGDERCSELASYADEVVEVVKERLPKIKDFPKSILLATGHTGLVYEPFHYLQKNVFDYLNCQCVNDEVRVYDSEWAVNVIDLKKVNEVEPSVIVLRDAEPLVFGDSGGPASVLWSNVTAIKEGRAFYVPATEFRWLGQPLVSQCLGVLWLGKILHPEYYGDIDVLEYAVRFYELFVHCDDAAAAICESVTNSPVVDWGA